MKAQRMLPAFSAAFIVLYVIAMEYNLALFTYHPALRRFEVLAAAPHGGPAMYWYGWLATAFLGALAVSAVALAVPERWAAWAWPALSWIVPTAAILVVAFLLRGYFIR